MRKLFLFFLAFTALFLGGCNEDDYDSSIPDYRVYLKLTYSDYAPLQTVGAYKVYSNTSGTYATNTYLGYGGLVIFRDFDGHIRCCDLACPYCYEKNKMCYRVTVSSSLLATCSNCSSIYNLQWGMCAPTEGPSKEKLKTYHCTDNGTSIIASYQ